MNQSNTTDFYKDKTVLLLGGQGYIGSMLRIALKKSGARVKVDCGRLDQYACSGILR